MKKILKSEKGMSKVELVVGIIVVLIIVSLSIFLSVGENGLSIFPNNKSNTANNVTQNTIM